MPNKQGEETPVEYLLNLIYMNIILAQKMMKENGKYEKISEDMNYMKGEISNILHDVWDVEGGDD
jgi:hypothetical protein